MHFFRRRQNHTGWGGEEIERSEKKEVALAVAVQTPRGPVWQGASNIYARQRQAANVKSQRINSPWNAAESEGTGLQVAGAETGYAAVWFANAKAAPASWRRERPDCCGGVCNGHTTKPTQRTSLQRERARCKASETRQRLEKYCSHYTSPRTEIKLVVERERERISPQLEASRF